MAGGNVRCGNCNHAFSALANLSESLPDDPASPADSVPGDDLARTREQLLEALNELAGPEDIRIEDTGNEWRVLDNEPPVAAETRDEPRYDDDTPLPDSFGDQHDGESAVSSDRRQEETHAPAPEEYRERDHDLALSEPEDWTDLLDEVMDPEVDALEVEEELAAIHTELSGVVATLEADDKAPAVLDLEVGASDDEPELDLKLDVSGESQALDLELRESAVAPELDLEVAMSAQPSELDFDIDEAEADSRPESELEAAEAPAESDAGSEEESADEPESVEDTESAEETGSTDDPETFEEPDESEDSQVPVVEFATIAHEPDADAASNDDEPEDRAASSDVGDDITDEDVATEAGETAEPVLTVLADGSSTEEESPEKENSTMHVPEPTEEEMTVNMEIDQELLAAAAQNEDIPATMVGTRKPEDIFEQNPEDVETIIMEGDFIHTVMDEARLSEESTAQDRMLDGINPVDTYALSRKEVGRRWWQIRPPGPAMTAAAILLVLSLGVQFVHYSRESLATTGFFSQTIAPIYRMIGMPVTPEWDVRGWQFEATNGSVNDEETLLTIVSRLGNRSATPLPYPLLHVSLTDRWEDIMGSRVVEPAEYLAVDLDPGRPVQPGDNFTAVIAIEDPSIEATGFKLNVCYRESPGSVRCAIEDFKN